MSTETQDFDARVKASGTFLTRSKQFKKLTKWAFGVCDSNHTGALNKAELYAGLMLIHLNLAKYAGPAACYPANRATVEQLFDACDDDNSGGIDDEEFEQIMVILCSQVMMRILVYYSILILLVPYIAGWILQALDIIGVDDTVNYIDHVWDTNAPGFMTAMVDAIPDSLWEHLPEQIISLSLFFLVVPMLFDKIDQAGYLAAKSVNVKAGGAASGSPVAAVGAAVKKQE